MYNIIARRESKTIQFDRKFKGDNCHHTGDEVLIDYDGCDPQWWCEFEDPNGEMHYGR